MGSKRWQTSNIELKKHNIKIKEVSRIIRNCFIINLTVSRVNRFRHKMKVYTSGILCKAMANAKLMPTRRPCWKSISQASNWHVINKYIREEVTCVMLQQLMIMWQIDKHMQSISSYTFMDPRNTAIPSGKLCKLMPRECTKKKQQVWNSEN